MLASHHNWTNLGDFPPKFFQTRLPNVSPECLSLLQSLMIWDPEKRIKWEGVFSHPFLQEAKNSTIVPTSSIGQNTSPIVIVSSFAEVMSSPIPTPLVPKIPVALENSVKIPENSAHMVELEKELRKLKIDNEAKEAIINTLENDVKR
jgi:serine/threonine protein kinase